MRLEHVISYFPASVIDNVEIMEYLRRGFEKCNAKAFNCHRNKGGDYFKVTLNVNGLKREFTYNQVENVKFRNETVNATVYSFKVVDENLRNNFQIISVPELGLVSFKGTLDNEKIEALTNGFNETFYSATKVKNPTKKARQKIAESSITAETRINNKQKKRYNAIFNQNQENTEEQAM